jgi:hypothetical protein
MIARQRGTLAGMTAGKTVAIGRQYAVPGTADCTRSKKAGGSLHYRSPGWVTWQVTTCSEGKVKAE